MSVESGAPDGKDFHVESHDDDDDEKSTDKKDFNFLKSWIENTKDKDESSKEEAEEPPQLFPEAFGSKDEEEPEEPSELEPEELEEIEAATPELEDIEYDEFEDVTPLPEYEEASFDDEMSPVSAPDEVEPVVDEAPEEIEETPVVPEPEVPTVETGPEEELEEEEAVPVVPTSPLADAAPTPPEPEEGGGEDEPPEPPEGPEGPELVEEPPEPEEEPDMEPAAAAHAAPDIDPVHVGAGVPPTPEANVPPVVINNRSGIPPLVGLGVAAYEHHRISKTRRESEKRDKEQQGEIDALKQQQMSEVSAAQAWRNRIEQEAADEIAEKQKLTQQEAARAEDQMSPEQKPEKPEEKAEKVAQAEPERQPAQKEKELEKLEKAKPRAEAVIPTVGEIIAERTRAKPQTQEVIAEGANFSRLNPEELLKPELSEKSSELLLQTTEAAAEQNVAQEIQYELRHEVKDVASTSLGATGASGPIQSGLAGQDEHQQTLLDLQKMHEARMRDYEAEKLNPASDQYKKAVWAGLWGGIVVIIAAAIWLIS
jgi:hypothetical protein